MLQKLKSVMNKIFGENNIDMLRVFYMIHSNLAKMIREIRQTPASFLFATKF